MPKFRFRWGPPLSAEAKALVALVYLALFLLFLRAAHLLRTGD